VGPRNRVLDGVQITQWKGKGVNHSKVQGHSAVICAKTAEPIEVAFPLWARMGPRNHVLDGVQIPHGKRQFWGYERPL